MNRYLIELEHSNDHEGCIRALDAIRRQGSHVITNAEFGCADGIHKGWLMVEAESHEAALRMAPPQYRQDTRVVQLRRWSKEEILEMMASLTAAAS